MRSLALTLLLSIASNGIPAVAENESAGLPTLAVAETDPECLARSARLREIFDFPISKAFGKETSGQSVTD